MPKFVRRFALPHIIAALLLSAFVAQCAWLINSTPLDDREVLFSFRYGGFHLSLPAEQLRAADQHHSRLIYYIASARPKIAVANATNTNAKLWMRLPFLLFGLLQAASLLYVSRRQFGWEGALIALALYVFSLNIVLDASRVWPDVLASWGFFGTIYLAMASAHTLYALPQTSSWHRRWRRPVLMGIALGVGTAAQYSVIIAAPLALAFLVYLAPQRWREGMLMWLAGVLIAVAIVFACGGKAQRFEEILSGGSATGVIFGVSPITFAFLLALIGWIVVRRARWFGNTSALVVVAVLALWNVLEPEQGLTYTLFTSVFTAGVASDLLGTRARRVTIFVILVLLGLHAIVDVRQLARI